jgi:hypothetical protein
MEVFGAIDTLEMHNNVFYRLGGGGVRLYRDDNATGTYLHAGTGNWIPSGSTSVPGTWIATKIGADPGFANANGRDFRLANGSVLIGAANGMASSPANHTFPSPLAVPTHLPPLHTLEAFGTATARSPAAPFDIGAY